MQNVHLKLYTHASHPVVEIIWPGGGAGPVDKLVQRHQSGTVYHLCYERGNLAAGHLHLAARAGAVVWWPSGFVLQLAGHRLD
jgi:hypothetical protein